MSATLAKRQRLHEANAQKTATTNAFPECKGTAYMQCSRTGVHTLQSTSTLLSMVRLQGLERDCAHKSISTTCWETTGSMLEKQPELAQLPQV